jgi:hypothetical protein
MIWILAEKQVASSLIAILLELSQDLEFRSSSNLGYDLLLST